MKTTLPLIAILALTAHSLNAAEPELRGTASELALHLQSIPKTVTIVGEAEVRAPADQAIVTLKVTTENKSLQEALRNNTDVRNRIATTFKSRGIPAERIHGSKFSSTPKFGLFGDKAKSYRVENLVRVTVVDEKEFQTVAAVVDGYPEAQYISAEFEHKNKEELKEKATAQALELANARREAFEKKLDIKLKPVRFYGGLSNPGPAGDHKAYGMEMSSAYGKRTGSITSLPKSADVNMEPPPVDSELVSFGEIVYKVELTVEYAVQEK